MLSDEFTYKIVPAINVLKYSLQYLYIVPIIDVLIQDIPYSTCNTFMYKVENIASLIVIKPVEVYIMDFTDVNMYQYKCMKNVFESF